MMRIVETAAHSRAAPGAGVDQDAVLVCGNPPLVAAIDGLGGPGRGDRAAKLVVGAIERKAPLVDKLARATERDRTSGARLALVKSIERAIGEIHGEIAALQEPSIGATLALAVFAAGYAHVAHVGAVRAYLLRDGTVRALTEDHTLGMARVRAGAMDAADYRSSPLRKRLYQALGSGAEVDVDVASVVLADRDVLLLCSDGVHGVLDDRTLSDCLSLKTADQAVHALCEAALQAGSTDDVSAVVVHVASESAPEEIDALARSLASTALFRDLTDSERLLVAPYLDRVDLGPNDQLFAEGDPAESFYVVVDGRVKVTRGGTPLTEIGPGGGFGELCLAGPRTARSAAVSAVVPSVVLGLSRDRFLEIVARRPAIGTRLLSRSLDLIGERLRDLTERLSQVEGLAIGELRPGDLALRTAIVLAARGEWPPEPTGEVPRPDVAAPPEVAGVAEVAEVAEVAAEPAPRAPAPTDSGDGLVAPPMPTPRQRRRLPPTGSTPVGIARTAAPPRPAPPAPAEAPAAPALAPVSLAVPLGELTLALPPGGLTGEEDTVLNLRVRRASPEELGQAAAAAAVPADVAPAPAPAPAPPAAAPVPPVPPLAALRRQMYRPDGEPPGPADLEIDVDDLGPDDETEM